MLFRLLADAVVVVHLGFVLFVVAGGFLVLRWPRAAWIQLPAAVWGIVVEWSGWICPLTPLENWLRARGGAAGYEAGFVERYLLSVLYPAGLTRTAQILLGSTALVVNLVAYLLAFRHSIRRRPGSQCP